MPGSTILFQRYDAVGVAEYRLTKELPTELQGKLPSVEDIKAEVLKDIKKTE